MQAPKLWFLENNITAKNNKFLKFEETNCVASSDRYETLDVLVIKPT